MVEISAKDNGNPAAMLRESLPYLMALSDPKATRDETLKILATARMSDTNRRKAVQAVSKKRTLFDIQKYIYDYILAADGHRVDRGALGTA